VAGTPQGEVPQPRRNAWSRRRNPGSPQREAWSPRSSACARRAALLACVAAVLVFPGVAVAGQRAKPKLTGESTLADWKKADAEARSEVAVTIARKRLGDSATKLEVATAAMEITGCVTVTARDSRFEAWQVAPTATTRLDAPERPEGE
jgi:hypothetical protein